MTQIKHKPLPEELEILGKIIVDCAYSVHKNLGPGLLEKIYEICFCHELAKRNINYQRQLDVPIKYDGVTFSEGLRLDVLIENVIIESTPKSLLTPKSPKGDFKGTLIFSDFPSGIKGKKSLENIFWTFRSGLIICELKAVDEVNPVWEAQILSHMKLTGIRLGYLINFNVSNIGNGNRRFIL